METKTNHGYTIYPADTWHKHPRLFCRDDDGALADIRDWLRMAKQPIEVVNAYETFYGCGWGHWLTEGVKDLATYTITEMQSSHGYGPDFPGAILLTPKK